MNVASIPLTEPYEPLSPDKLADYPPYKLTLERRPSFYARKVLQPAVDCDYVVIGGGFAGLNCARKLADAGFHVTVLESADRLLGGASSCNMARIHHGWHYPGSLETALKCIPAAFDFIEEFGDVLVRSEPSTPDPFQRGLCLLAHGSFTAPDAWLAQAETLRASYAAELGRRTSTFGPPSEFFRILDPADWDNVVSPEKIQLAASTLEPFVDIPAFVTKVTGMVQDHPRISVLTGHEVVDASPVTLHDTPQIELTVRMHGESVKLFRANQVINASWSGRRKLDMCLVKNTATVDMPSVTYRLRAFLRVELPSDLRFLPSLLAVHGPFCSFTNNGDGTGLVSCEPASDVATMPCIVPAEWTPILRGKLPPAEQAHLARSILDGIGQFVPGLRQARPMEVIGNILYHCGRVDIYDPSSAIHHRLGIGMNLIGENWISLDSGKLSWIPRYANEIVKHCTKEPLVAALL